MEREQIEKRIITFFPIGEQPKNCQIGEYRLNPQELVSLLKEIIDKIESNK